MTGGFDARRLAANSASDEFSGSKSSVTDGTFDFGKVPPPLFALPWPIVTFIGKFDKCDAIVAARARNVSSEVCRSVNAGISPVF